MPIPGFKSLTVKEETYAAARELAELRKTSIANEFDEALMREYRNLKIHIDSEKSSPRTLTKRPTTAGSQLRGIVAESTIEELTLTEVEVQDALVKAKEQYSKRKWDTVSMTKVIDAYLQLARLHRRDGNPSSAQESLKELKKYLAEVEKGSIDGEYISQAQDSIDDMIGELESGGSGGPMLKELLVIEIPGKNPIIIASRDYGDAYQILPAASELIKHR